MGYPFRYGANSVLLNERGQHFIDAEFALGVEPRQAGIEIPYFTIDCSGEDKDKGMCYHKKGLYRVLASTSSRSSVIVDIDDDGDLDIITNDMNDRPQILISSLAQTKKINFLKVRLIGTTSNRDGIGAVVRVKSGGEKFTRFNDGKSGYLAQSQMPLYFGLGDNSKLDSIEVTWPSGKTQTVNQGLNLNGLLTITEPR